MSNIIPIKSEYQFEVRNHRMRAISEHLEKERRIAYFFDDKLVSKKNVPAGNFLTDDDWIRGLVENYCENQVGVYADLFRNHMDSIYLLSKTFEFRVEDFGIKMLIKTHVEKECYHISVDANNGDAVFTGTFKAADFSEVLEKIRIFTNTLAGVGSLFSNDIDELANDQIEQVLKWK